MRVYLASTRWFTRQCIICCRFARVTTTAIQWCMAVCRNSCSIHDIERHCRAPKPAAHRNAVLQSDNTITVHGCLTHCCAKNELAAVLNNHVCCLVVAPEDTLQQQQPISAAADWQQSVDVCYSNSTNLDYPSIIGDDCDDVCRKQTVRITLPACCDAMLRCCSAHRHGMQVLQACVHPDHYDLLTSYPVCKTGPLILVRHACCCLPLGSVDAARLPAVFKPLRAEGQAQI